MTRPRSDIRSGASSRSRPDAAALRRDLYRPGADGAAVEAYLAAVAAEGFERSEPPGEPGTGTGTAQPPAAPPPHDGPGAPEMGASSPRRSRRWRPVALAGVIAVAVPAVGLALLPWSGPAPAPTPASTRSPSGPVPAPATFYGGRGSKTFLVGVPWRTSRVRIGLECSGVRPTYGWTAFGEDSQTQQFIPVLEHSGDCSPTATFVGPLPGDVDILRIVISVDGAYAMTVEPL